MYFELLKLEQQKISALSTTENETIKNSPKTLKVVKESLKNYITLANDASKIISAFPKLENNEENQKKIKKIDSFNTLLLKYVNDTNRLKELINNLEEYQKSLQKQEKIAKDTNSTIQNNSTENKDNYFTLIILGAILLAGIIALSRKGKKDVS